MLVYSKGGGGQTIADITPWEFDAVGYSIHGWLAVLKGGFPLGLAVVRTPYKNPASHSKGPYSLVVAPTTLQILQLGRSIPNCGVPPLRIVVSSLDPLLRPSSGVVANCPPTEVCW